LVDSALALALKPSRHQFPQQRAFLSWFDDMVPVATLVGVRLDQEGSWREEFSMADEQIHDEIERLVAEEQELWQRESAGTAGDAERRRLESVKVSLDQCWDLLRQRRALRESGLDPSAASVRQPETVERYEQ
jgi:hypothetical protein